MDPEDVPPEIERRLAKENRASTTVAIVGATTQGHKYGNIILRDLVSKGFPVIPVNPNERKIEGLEAYRKVADAPPGVSIVNFVVPPEIGLEVLKELDPAKIDCVWFQPGAGSAAIRKYAIGRFKYVLDGPCIMVLARRR